MKPKPVEKSAYYNCGNPGPAESIGGLSVVLLCLATPEHPIYAPWCPLREVKNV